MTEPRLQDQRTRLDTLLRSCVECGLCLPTCATWLATGNEVQSPRGRLLLLGEWLGQEDEAPPRETLQALDQCIGCRACESSCPSGVSFSLLEFGQEMARGGDHLPPGSLPAGLVPDFVMKRMDQVRWLRVIGRTAAGVRRLVALLLGRRWRRRMEGWPRSFQRPARLLGSLPSSPHRDEDLIQLLDRIAGPAQDLFVPPQRRMPPTSRVTLHPGCANQGLLPGSTRRLTDFLAAAKVEVEVPAEVTCCGALARHMGDEDRADALRYTNTRILGGMSGTKHPILVEAAGCGLEFRSYPESVSARIQDPATFLANLPWPEIGEVPLRVAVHDPCHARHGIRSTQAVREVLDRIPGLEWVEPLEPDVCCGSGGTWGLRYPEISADLAGRKAEYLARTGAQVVVTTNPGCLGQISDGLAVLGTELPIMPLSDLLWLSWMRAGGQNRP